MCFVKERLRVAGDSEFGVKERVVRAGVERGRVWEVGCGACGLLA